MLNIYSNKEVQKVLMSGEIAYNTHMLLAENVRPGISTFELNDIAESSIRQSGSVPAFLNYEGYPACICTSVNDAIVHGIPKKSQILKEGDIIGIDLGVNYEGYFTDTAWTWPVGKVSKEAEKLVSVTQKCMFKGIQNAIPGNRIGNISYSVQQHAESNGFSVVRNLVGHGIGRSLHEEPQVPNFGRKKDGAKIRSGMIIAIEPMINIGSYGTTTDEDNWTIRTQDGTLSAHFEHTVAITTEGPVICTLPEKAETDVFKIMQERSTVLL